MDQPQRFVLIANPTSGRGKALRLANELCKRLSTRGHSAQLYVTKRTGDGNSITVAQCMSSGAPDCIVACGGDGTMQEVAHALVSVRNALGDGCPSMGIVPAGRCNDFARGLGIDSHVESLLAALVRGSTRSIDLGCVNGRHFCTVATVGVDADISSFVDQMRIPLRGTAAYVYGTLRVLLRYTGRVVRLEGEFGVIERSVFVASSANTSSYGGAIPIAPNAVPTDGLLDLCLIDFQSRLRSLAMLPKVLRGRHISLPGVRFIRTNRVQISTDDGVLPIWADGERIGTSPATIATVANAVRIRIPTEQSPPA